MLFLFGGVIGRGRSLGLGGGSLGRPFRRIPFSFDVDGNLLVSWKGIEAGRMRPILKYYELEGEYSRSIVNMELS